MFDSAYRIDDALVTSVRHLATLEVAIAGTQVGRSDLLHDSVNMVGFSYIKYCLHVNKVSSLQVSISST